MASKGVQKRVKRLKASGLSGKEAKTLAKKRAKNYKLASKLNPREMETVKSNSKIMRGIKSKRGESTKGTYREELKRKVKNRKKVAKKPSSQYNAQGSTPDVKPKSKKTAAEMRASVAHNKKTTMQTKVIKGTRYTKSIKEWEALRKANPGFFGTTGSGAKDSIGSEIRKSAGVSHGGGR